MGLLHLASAIFALGGIFITIYIVLYNERNYVDEVRASIYSGFMYVAMLLGVPCIVTSVMTFIVEVLL
jgi:hypothetical protein